MSSTIKGLGNRINQTVEFFCAVSGDHVSLLAIVIYLGFILGWWKQETSSVHLFEAIGFFGLSSILLQAVFGLLVGHDGDTNASGSIDVHGGHGGGGGYLSMKSVSAMLLGFGFGGALLEKNGYSVGIAALGGIGIGLAIAASYILLMNSLYRLRSDGTAVLSEAINRSGTVYLSIPGHASGAGEIQVSFGGRLQNIRAYTHGPELSNGTGVRVVALHGERALMVERLS